MLFAVAAAVAGCSGGAPFFVYCSSAIWKATLKFIKRTSDELYTSAMKLNSFNRILITSMQEGKWIFERKLFPFVDHYGLLDLFSSRSSNENTLEQATKIKAKLFFCVRFFLCLPSLALVFVFMKQIKKNELRGIKVNFFSNKTFFFLTVKKRLFFLSFASMCISWIINEGKNSWPCAFGATRLTPVAR